MKIIAFQDKPWKITKDLSRNFCDKRLEETLNLFNRVSDCRFFMVDYSKKRIVTGNSASSTLTGFSQALIEYEGFNFYHRIMDEEEMNWLKDFSKEACNVFFDCSRKHRGGLEFIYDLVATKASGKVTILRHRLVPYQLCKNDNLWLGLCSVSEKAALQYAKAFVTNSETGELYNFVGNKFVLSKTKILSHTEKQILKMMGEGLSNARISNELCISESILKREKQRLYKKLNAKTPVSALYNAVQLGLF